MRLKIILTLTAIAGLILAWNLRRIFLEVPDVVEAFPGKIQSLSVSKPTLEDVFIHRTGHRFWNEEAEATAETGKKKAKKKH